MMGRRCGSNGEEETVSDRDGAVTEQEKQSKRGWSNGGPIRQAEE